MSKLLESKKRKVLYNIDYYKELIVKEQGKLELIEELLREDNDTDNVDVEEEEGGDEQSSSSTQPFQFIK